jgi:hypothetical protein
MMGALDERVALDSTNMVEYVPFLSDSIFNFSSDSPLHSFFSFSKFNVLFLPDLILKQILNLSFSYHAISLTVLDKLIPQV